MENLKPHIYDNALGMQKLFEITDNLAIDTKFLWDELVRFFDYETLSGAPLRQYAANVGVDASGLSDEDIIRQIDINNIKRRFFGNAQEYLEVLEGVYGIPPESVTLLESEIAKFIIRIPDGFDTAQIEKDLQGFKAGGIKLQVNTGQYADDYTYEELEGFTYEYVEDNMFYSREE